METAAARGQRMLIVDDDELMRELLPALMNLQGYEVHTEASGDRAIRWLESHTCPDIILTDLQMPGLEGEPLLHALRAAAVQSTLLLGMSGSRPAQPLFRVMDDFLPKPFSSAQFEQTVRRAAATRAAWALPADIASPLPEERDQESRQETGPESHQESSPGNSLESSPNRTAEFPTPEAGSPEPPLDPAIFTALAARFRAHQLMELYTLTLDDVARRHALMEELAAAGELLAVQREAHAIKGLCGMVGARELLSLATAVEGGTTLNIAVLANFPAASLRLRRMLDAKFQQPQ